MTVTWHANEAERWHSEAERWRSEADRLVAENAALRAQVVELEGQVAALTEKVATLAKLVFGDSSEKKPTKSKADGAEKGEKDERQERRSRGQQPGSRGHGRRDYSGLNTKEEIHDVPEGERVCPQCGAEYVSFGAQTSEQIDWEVRIVRIVHRRPTYRRTCSCAVPGMLVAAVPPKPIPKGLFTAQFLARLLVEKYVLGRPLCRIAAALGNEGLDVAEGTLVGVMKKLSDLLAPLDAGIRARNGSASHLHVDETTWKVFEPVADKANYRWWLWVFSGADTTVFTIERSRSTKVLTEHLGIDLKVGTLEADRHLLVSSDFFTAYQSLAKVDGVDPLWCWAHIRRYFIRASDAHEELAAWSKAWLERIGALYRAHQTLGETEVGSAEHARSQAAFVCALDAIDTARQAEATDDTLHLAARKVLETLDHEWEGLARHQEFSELPLDNNTAERALRNPVVGRKNYYGSGSVWSSELAGRVWTVTATAAQAGCNSFTYLLAYLNACAEAGGKPPEAEALFRFFVWQATEADLAVWRDAPSGPAP